MAPIFTEFKKNGNCQFFLVQKTKFENNTLLALIDLKEKHRIDSKKVIRKKINEKNLKTYQNFFVAWRQHKWRKRPLGHTHLT